MTVVHLLEVVDVEQAEGQREASSCALSRSLEPLVEVAVIAEPGQRVGQRKAHGLERAVHRALVERDGDKRADEAVARKGDRSQRTASMRLTEAMIEKGTAVQ